MTHNRLPIPWVRHLKDQDSKDRLEQAIRASSTALSRLYDLLEEEEESLTKQESTVADFSDGSWAYKQAFRNGQRTSLRQLKQLLAFTQKG